MATISNSVGKNQPNNIGDVATIQVLLNKFLLLGCLPGLLPLIPDGVFGAKTATAIIQFQLGIVGMSKPDCWITSSCTTLTALNGPIKWAVPSQPTAPPISGGQYVRWVKGSLNRLLGCTLRDTSSTTDEYRVWVKEFQVNQHLSPNGQVDSKTQDALMSRNRNFPDYVSWVQKALCRSGEADGKLAINGFWSDAVSDVVRVFQMNEGLKEDGYVGAKTETALMQRSGLPVSGRLKTNKPYQPRIPDPYVWQDSLSPELRMNVWLNAMLIDRKSSPPTGHFVCMARKLAENNQVKTAYAYLTRSVIKEYIRAGWPAPRTIEKIAEDARTELLEKTRQMQKRATYAKGWDGFQYFTIELDKQIFDGLNALTEISNDDYDRHNTNVRELLKWVAYQKEQWWSVLSCYGGVSGE